MDRKALALFDDLLRAAFAALLVLNIAIAGVALLERWLP